jgi:hypothetical protein
VTEQGSGKVVCSSLTADRTVEASCCFVEGGTSYTDNNRLSSASNLCSVHDNFIKRKKKLYRSLRLIFHSSLYYLLSFALYVSCALNVSSVAYWNSSFFSATSMIKVIVHKQKK